MVDCLFGQQHFGFVHFYSALPVKSISCVDCRKKGILHLEVLNLKRFFAQLWQEVLNAAGSGLDVIMTYRRVSEPALLIKG
jgi:hypothetical protein